MPATIDFADLKSWVDSIPGTKAAGTLPELSDDGKPATEGARSAENCKDVKKVVPGQNVDAGKDNPETGNADKPIADSGLEQTTVGKMPSVEKAVKVVEEESEKMAAADVTTDAGYAACRAALEKAAAVLPVYVAKLTGRPAAQFQPNATPAVPTPSGLPAGSKEAADKAAAAEVAAYQRLGADHGMRVSHYLRGYYDQLAFLTKAAEDGSLDASLAGAPPGGEMPPGGPGGGGAPPMAAGPDAAAGAPPGGPEGGGGGAPSLDDVAAAMAEMGLTPDDVMQIATKMKGDVGGTPGGAPGGPPPGGDAGGAPADDAAKAAAYLDSVIKVATDVKTLMRGGKFALKPAGDGTADRKRRDVAKGYIQELYEASRA